MGHLSCGSRWWIPPSRCPGPGLTCDSVFSPGDLYSEQNSARSTRAPSPPFPAPCSQILFSFASDSTQLLPQANTYLAALHAVVQHTGKNEPSCWHLGPWANKQKRKMVHVGDDEVERKIGTERWLRSLPFSPPNLCHSPGCKERPLQFIGEDKGSVVDPGHFPGMERAVGRTWLSCWC